MRGEAEYLVQVKHDIRQKGTKEGVRAIRELHGVLLGRKEPRGIFVSSRAGYSAPAISEIREKETILPAYEMMTYDVFDISRWVYTTATRPWVSHLRPNSGYEQLYAYCIRQKEKDGQVELISEDDRLPFIQRDSGNVHIPYFLGPFP